MRHSTNTPGVYWRETKNGERRYQISYLDSNKTRAFKTVDGNYKDACAALRDVKTRMGKGERVVSSRMTMEQLAEDYLKTQTSHLREATKENYETSLKTWVIPFMGNRRVTQVDVSLIADFLFEMRDKRSASTARNCLKPLSGMFQYAARRGWIGQNPVSQLNKNELPKGSPRRMRVLSTDEINALLKVKNPQPTSHLYRLLFMTAIFAGLRKGELLALTWEDVDLLGGSVRVREGKTEAAARVVAIPEFLVKELAKQMKTEGRVFPFQKRNVNRALEDYLEKIKAPHARFHDLRHTYVSIQISLGMDAAYIARQAGHRSPATTLSVYAHLFDSFLREAEAKKRMQETFKEVVG